VGAGAFRLLLVVAKPDLVTVQRTRIYWIASLALVNDETAAVIARDGSDDAIQ
jgi:hypothetical protein